MTTSPTTSPASRAHQEVRIDRERLWAALMELKEIGAYDETRPACGACGASRSPTPTPKPAAAACSG